MSKKPIVPYTAEKIFVLLILLLIGNVFFFFIRDNANIIFYNEVQSIQTGHMQTLF